MGLEYKSQIEGRWRRSSEFIYLHVKDRLFAVSKSWLALGEGTSPQSVMPGHQECRK